MLPGPYDPVGVSGRSNDRKLRRGLVRIGRVGIGEQAGRRQFPAEREDAFGFGKRRIVVIHMGAFEQFSDDALVDLGILPEIQRSRGGIRTFRPIG